VADKLTKKELKEPDAFQRVGDQARDWMEKRLNLILIIAALVLVGGAGAALASYVSQRGEEKAAAELGAQLKLLSRPVQEGAEAPPQPVEGQDPPFKTEKEKHEAIAKAMADFRSNHKGTRAAGTAALALADAQFKLGQYDQASTAYKAYLEAAPKEDPMRAAAQEGLGYSFEAQKQYDQAFTAFGELAKTKGEFLAGMGQYHQARILVLQGKKDEAAKMLSDLTTAHPGTAAARLAQDRITVLAAEGVKIPTPAPAPTVTGTDAGTK
jgi:TolA-binding protein